MNDFGQYEFNYSHGLPMASVVASHPDRAQNRRLDPFGRDPLATHDAVVGAYPDFRRFREFICAAVYRVISFNSDRFL
jgi:hypothetical protein